MGLQQSVSPGIQKLHEDLVEPPSFSAFKSIGSFTFQTMWPSLVHLFVLGVGCVCF